MNTITTKDGVSIYYKDWGKGQPVVFSHGWPLNADAWDPQMLFLGQHGYRVIAHDRRSHGRSEQTWDGNNMDTYADDLAQLFESLDLKDAVMVGHSTGGGEVARYLGRHGSKRVSKAALISSVPPILVQSATRPDGVPKEALDGIRQGTVNDRPQYLKDFSMPFYGFNLPNAKISEGVRENFVLQGLQAGLKGLYDCIGAFSETDFTEDLKKIDVPTLLLHGDADQIVPLPISSQLTAKLVKNATLKVYPGFPHGMCTTEADTINRDLLAFIQS
jgi:non-heme chloroperoxidase